MAQRVSKETIGKWLKGWSLSRNLPLPGAFRSGYKVEVGYEKQKTRFVFPELNQDVLETAQTIEDPWIYIKVCEKAEKVKSLLSPNWIIQPQGYMMERNEPMCFGLKEQVTEYHIEYESLDQCHLVRILDEHGMQASVGRVILVEDLAIYDRISTEPKHQRKGLGTIVIKELEKVALSNGITKNILVATEAGRKLYGSLGWEVHSFYTSFVIPG
jgi:GNAT superfamily N-acetyltransferase